MMRIVVANRPDLQFCFVLLVRSSLIDFNLIISCVERCAQHVFVLLNNIKLYYLLTYYLLFLLLHGKLVQNKYGEI